MIDELTKKINNELQDKIREIELQIASLVVLSKFDQKDIHLYLMPTQGGFTISELHSISTGEMLARVKYRIKSSPISIIDPKLTLTLEFDNWINPILY